MTYLITFACYGCHMHGDESGSIDRKHNLYGGRVVSADPRRLSAERQLMDQPPYGMDRNRRETVLASLRERDMHGALLELVGGPRAHQPRSPGSGSSSRENHERPEILR